MNPKQIREQVTQKIVAALEAGTVPWRRPWSVSGNAGRPMNVVSKKAYRGINTLLLHLHSMRHGFSSKWFGTFDQIKASGGMVKKRPADVEPGQWGCHVIFFKPVQKTVIDKDTGREREEQFGLLRTYTVFNVDQCDGEALDRFRVIDTPDDGSVFPDFEPADRLIAATGADIRYGGEAAFYRSPTPEGSWPNHKEGDYICVPRRNRFPQIASWYETILHEMAHWSEVRLSWDRKGEGYEMGELIAELSACMLAAELAIPTGEGLDNHVAYLKDWLKKMKADPTYIFKASAQASKITDFLMSFAPKAEAQPVEFAAV